MKFSEMPYERPDLDAVKKQYSALTERLKAAGSYEEARTVFLEKEELDKHVQTLATLSHVRHSIDTRDAFYDAEAKFWNAAEPELQEYTQAWTRAMLDGAFRAQFAAQFGELMFVNAEIELKTFSPEIIPELQQENELAQEYEKLLASAQIPFEGGVYTISQMTPFKSDPDDARRLAAWKAEGQWYKDNQDKLDGIYDQLVHLRDTMGRKLGYEGYTTLGYYRMGRNCYTKEDVEQFRLAVQKYLVPVADGIYREQAKRLGKQYPMSFADNALEFRSGNPRPVGTPEQILEQGRKFYNELSPETSAFFNMMMDNELLDVLSTEGKEGGGYCTSIPDYGVPFIFANFNGTQGDVEVVTHEAGHAFAAYINRDRIPMSTVWPSMEGCEVHSMSMEFMAWPWSEGFFGKDARKFHYSHLASALTFIPYGTMVDHFQHIVYEHPELTPAQRHAEWKRLLGIYMPWQKLDGEIPFYSEGEGWQRQHHIYSSPFYYIDYCLAQTVSLQIWALLQKDQKDAWAHYMAYARQGGSRTFTELLKNAGLESPFDEKCLRGVCETASKWLAGVDMTGIE
ncbi:MAG: M3 family oligoendopeptidase [Oscillospiraceae bacterium]|nr:M3 family oligoendopeptidase [Eubacteriales bacterium]MDY2618499.1 M3 family oligoendopeptidase [Oscillospiraceae bacterium]